MRTFLFRLLLLAATFVFQTTVAEYGTQYLGVKPDLVLVVTIYFAVSRGRQTGTGLGFLMGIFQDALSGLPLGMNGLSKGLIGFILGDIRQKLASRSVVAHVSFGFMATLLDGLLFVIVQALILPEVPLPADFFRTLLKITALNAILAPAVLMLLFALEERLARPMAELPLFRSLT